MKIKFAKTKCLIAVVLFLFSIISCSSLPPQVKNPIKLTLDMVINECACSNATGLVDEQKESGYLVPTSYWKLDKCHSTVSIPSAVIDLGAEYTITMVHFFDSYGTGAFEINYGTPFQWNSLLVDSMNHFQYWNSKTVNIKTRYLQLKSKDWIFPAEILLEGTKIPAKEAEISKNKTRVYARIGEFLGTNAFVDDPIGLLSPFGSIREYHSWFAWNQQLPGEIAFNPTDQGFNFDLYYRNLNQLGLLVSPALQQSPKWLTNFDNVEAKPVETGKDSYKPSSYLEHAKFIYQYAARYGNGNVDQSKLILKSNQERKTNLNYLQYYENWNEEDKWWKGKEGYFSPYEYAAMSSADYDGNLNTLGNEIGIKAADPNAKLVMGGIANPNIEYIKALKLWSDFNRNGNFPWKVINIHHYSNDGGGQFQSKKGISPEDDHLKEKLEVFTKYRDKFLPEVDVWLSEFGYDVKDDSPQKSSAIGGMNSEEVQAVWLVRAYLAAAAAGIDKAFQYMIRDGEGRGLYMSSGMYYWKKEGESTQAMLRPSWYYTATLQKLLGNYRFEKEMASKNENVKMYTFGSAAKAKVYAVWCNTSKDQKIASYQLTVPAGYQYVWQVNLVDKNSKGSVAKIKAQNGIATLAISEKPVFLVMNNEVNFAMADDDHLLKLSPAMIVNETGSNADALADEQDKIGDPDKGIYKEIPKTNWEVPYNQSLPANVYVDLGKEYLVTKLYLHDGNSSGNLIISTGKPGNWIKTDEDNLLSYNSWKSHVLMSKTRYIRLSRTNASSGINELAVYVKE